MRRISTLMLLAGAVAFTGCWSSPGSGSSGSSGVNEQNFQVKINQPPIGGTVASSDAAQISCGASSVTVVGTAPNLTYSWAYYGSGSAQTNKCSGTYAWTSTSTGTAVTLTATPASGYVFVGWAADCTGTGTCALAGPADKTAVAIFAKQGEQGHGNFLVPASTHVAAYHDRSLDCARCHGAEYQGQGIAPACNLCHAMPSLQSTPPVVTATASGSMVGTLIQVSYSAVDPDAAETVSCTAALQSQPAGSSATLVGGAAADCRAALQTVSFVPAVAGAYVVRVTVNDGLSAPVVRDVTVAAVPGDLPSIDMVSTGSVTESLVSVNVLAADPDAGQTITCTVDLVSQPAFSAVTLSGGAAADCRAAAQVASFTPAFPGAYTLRATVSDGGASPAVRDLIVNVTSAYTGGTVAGTSATIPATTTQLIADLGVAVTASTAVNAVTLYRAMANIVPNVPPTTGAASTQGAAFDWATRPYDILDVRDPANYAAGHIPGAINVPFQKLPDVLLAQPWFPATSQATARKIMVVDYGRGDSSLASILVSVARVGAIGGAIPAAVSVSYLQDGMATWTFDKASVPYRWSDDLGTYRFEWTSAANPNYLASGGTWAKPTAPVYEYPNLQPISIPAAYTGNAAALKRILVRAREWAAWAYDDTVNTLGRPAAEAFTTNWGYYKWLRDNSQPYVVLSNQSATQWAAGRALNSYVAGSFAFGTLGASTPADLALLNPADPILFHCFSNGSAVAPCYRLSILGYKSRTVLYGITGAVPSTNTAAGWNSFANSLTDTSAGGNEFPISSSVADPQDLAWTQPAANGCRACHTSYGKLYSLAALQPGAPAEAPESEGEG